VTEGNGGHNVTGEKVTRPEEVRPARQPDRLEHDHPGAGLGSLD
jgi:hypothetical protein